MMKQKRIIFMAVIIFALSGLLFFFMSAPLNHSPLSAQNGILDLSGESLERTVYPLQGEWEFYFGHLYTPEDFESGTPEGRNTIQAPSAWDAGAAYPSDGYATYRLTLITGQEPRMLMFLQEINSASAVFINGERVFSGGTVDAAPELTTSSAAVALLPFETDGGRVEIVVQAANYACPESGMFYPIKIGTEPSILHYFFLTRGLAVLALGAILMIGIYHLLLFLFRKKERIYLIFSLLCLVTFVRFLFDSNGILQYLVEDWQKEPYLRLYFFLYTLHGGIIFLFAKKAFSFRCTRIEVAVYGGIYVLTLLASLVLPPRAAYSMMFILYIPIIISIVKSARSGKIKDNSVLGLYFVSMLVYAIFGGIAKVMLDSTWFYTGLVNNVLMILFQSVVLSYHYAEAFHRVEETNSNLEQIVTERTQALSASQNALREMIANISHDLKTPLTALGINLEILNEGTILTDPQEQAAYINTAYHKNLDLQRLIKNLFEVTRMESGQLVYRCEWLEISDILTQLSKKYTEDAQTKGVTLETKCNEDFKIYADTDKLWSVFDNVIYNALKYTSAGDRIMVTAQRTETGGEICIRDTGIGIAPEHLPHIFERFYKGSLSRNVKDGSSGIGLYIVKTTMKAMSGTVRAESVLGEGTGIILEFQSE